MGMMGAVPQTFMVARKDTQGYRYSSPHHFLWGLY